VEKKTSKVGPITLAIGLIASGLVLLLYNFGVVSSLTWLWKLWPLLLIGVGVEYFIRKRIAGKEEVRFHAGSLILIIILIIVGGAAYAVATISKDFGGFFNGIPWYRTELAYQRNWESEPVQIKAEEELVINNKIGEIKLFSAPGNELKVKSVIHSAASGASRELADKINPEIKREENRVIVQMPENGNTGDRYLVIDMEIAVPVGVNVRVDSGTGRVYAEKMDQNMIIVGNTGTIELRAIGGDVEIRNNTGRVEVFEPGGDLLAETNTGSIEVTSDRPLTGKYQLKSNTGLVSLQLPKESDLLIAAESRTGKVTLEGLSGNLEKEGLGNKYSYKLGAGKGLADLRVGTGAINITVR